MINSSSARDLVDQSQDTRTLLHFPHVYDRPLDSDMVAFIKVCVAPLEILVLYAYPPSPGHSREVPTSDPASRNFPYGAKRDRFFEARDPVQVFMR